MKFKELPFEPCPVISDPHQQTYFSSFMFWVPRPFSEPKVIPVSDGDKIVMEITTPYQWKPTDLTVLCVHGLCGSHESSYLLRLTNLMEPSGIRVARFNMRGCGSGRGLAKQIYHSGRSEDVFDAAKALKKENPLSPIILIGFSLGGNIVLKMMGELGKMGGAFIDEVIAVSPPMDLLLTASRISAVAGGIYERYFYKRLRNDVHALHKRFKDLPRIQLPNSMRLWDFDALYTVPRSGFVNVEDYYTRCSAIHYLNDIEVPCKILLSGDDPIVSHESVDGLHLPSNIEVYKTKRGGHMGYLGDPRLPRGFYWLDSVLAEWILYHT